MDFFNHKATTTHVNSKAACDYLAQKLREIANDFEARSKHLEQARNNHFQIDDKAPALHVANQALIGWKSGACPATICQTLSAKYYVDKSVCMEIFERKRRAHERNAIENRNQLILKWDYEGISQVEICRRVGLSKSYVSKILSRSRP